MKPSKSDVVLLTVSGWPARTISKHFSITVVELRRRYRFELRYAFDIARRDFLRGLRRAADRGSVSALKELGRLTASERSSPRPDAAEFEARRRERMARPGKKTLAVERAERAGEGTEWADDLRPLTSDRHRPT